MGTRAHSYHRAHVVLVHKEASDRLESLRQPSRWRERPHHRSRTSALTCSIHRSRGSCQCRPITRIAQKYLPGAGMRSGELDMFFMEVSVNLLICYARVQRHLVPFKYWIILYITTPCKIAAHEHPSSLMHLILRPHHAPTR